MITTTLMGGLGNQMFQYAAGKVLAEKHRTSLQLYSRRAADYRLHPFDIKGKVVSDYPPTPLMRLCPKAIRYETRPFTMVLGRCLGFCSLITRDAKRRMTRQVILNELASPTSESFLGTKSHVFLRGCWQKHAYYEPIADALARDFTVKTKPNAANRDVLRRIRASSEAVAVHVRRGDYQSSSYHYLCSPNYYRAAFRHLREVLTDPVFFVFSDDMQWAKRHLSPPGETHYIDNNGPSQSHEDMRLMQACSHFVIANSTFSWWPAWLADAPDKIVIAPKMWHTPEVDERRCLGKHCPEDWLRL